MSQPATIKYVVIATVRDKSLYSGPCDNKRVFYFVAEVGGSGSYWYFDSINSPRCPLPGPGLGHGPSLSLWGQRLTNGEKLYSRI